MIQPAGAFEGIAHGKRRCYTPAAGPKGIPKDSSFVPLSGNARQPLPIGSEAGAGGTVVPFPERADSRERCLGMERWTQRSSRCERNGRVGRRRARLLLLLLLSLTSPRARGDVRERRRRRRRRARRLPTLPFLSHRLERCVHLSMPRQRSLESARSGKGTTVPPAPASDPIGSGWRAFPERGTNDESFGIPFGPAAGV